MLTLIVSNYNGTLYEHKIEDLEALLEAAVTKNPDGFWTDEADEYEHDEERWLYIDAIGGWGPGYIQIDSIHAVPEDQRTKTIEHFGEPVKL